MKKISAVLISYNEEEKVERALESLRDVADEIVVVDSHSTDRTEEICRRFTGRFLQRTWPGYREQKQFATDQARHEWVLSLDCDEELSEALRGEIRDWKSAPAGRFDGYELPRLTWFMGRWIRHTTWHPDWQLRLFRRHSGAWRGGRVHESFRTEGPTARFRNKIHHFTYASFSEYLRQLDRFSTLAALDNLDRGRSVGALRTAFEPGLVFLKNYLLKRGFLDGRAGLAVSSLAAVSTLFKHYKLWELRTNGKVEQAGDDAGGRGSG